MKFTRGSEFFKHMRESHTYIHTCMHAYTQHNNEDLEDIMKFVVYKGVGVLQAHACVTYTHTHKAQQ